MQHPKKSHPFTCMYELRISIYEPLYIILNVSFEQNED